MNFADFEDVFFQQYGIKIVPGDVVPLFHIDYWDMPLTMIFKCHDKYFFANRMENLNDGDGDNLNSWYAFLLTDEQTEIALFRNKMFCEYVGEHTNYVWDAHEFTWTRKTQEVKPKEFHAGFYSLDLPRISPDDITLDNPSFGIVDVEIW